MKSQRSSSGQRTEDLDVCDYKSGSDLLLPPLLTIDIASVLSGDVTTIIGSTVSCLVRLSAVSPYPTYPNTQRAIRADVFDSSK